MAIFVTALALAVIIGAWLWLRPSTREKRVNQLQTQAFAHGLKLRYETLPDMSIEGRIRQDKRAFTFFNRQFKDKQGWPAYTVLRTTGDSSKYLPDGWFLQHGEQLSRADMDERLHSKLAALPAPVIAVTQWSFGYGLAIDEGYEVEIEDILQWLAMLQWN